MRILVFGSGGMIGHKLTQVFAQRAEVWATVRSAPQVVSHFTGVPTSRLINSLDATDPGQVAESLDRARPDVVVNAVGLIKQSPQISDGLLTQRLNVELPHQLSRECVKRGVRLVHFSTDCVFSGRTGNYSEVDTPDADDAYGRSKAKGEVLGPGALVIRTSTVGREITGFHGLLEWFLSHPPGAVPGYSRAIWSGFPSVTLANLVLDILESQPDLTGLYNLASLPVNKFQLLSWLSEAFGGAWQVQQLPEPELDRSLDGSRLVAATGIAIPSWPQMIDDLLHDSMRHDKLRKLT